MADRAGVRLVDISTLARSSPTERPVDSAPSAPFSPAAPTERPVDSAPSAPFSPAAQNPAVSAVAPTPRPRRRITVRRNDDKMGPFVTALQQAGHEFVDGPGDVTFTDVEMAGPVYGDLLDLNDVAVVYPHGPGPALFTDGMGEPHPKVVANFVVGDGCADVFRAAGYPAEVIPVGWPYGDLRPFRATEGRRILFAPIHPDAHGYLARDIRAANRAALEAVADTGAEVKVRHVGSLRANGLCWRPDVEFAPARSASGELRPPEVDIDEADVVVALGTFAYLSVSRGAPTVMFFQRRWNNDFRFAGQPLFFRRWSSYAPIFHYPFDLLDGDVARTLARAAAGDTEIADWRRRFVGDPFDPVTFAADFDRVVESGPLRHRSVVGS